MQPILMNRGKQILGLAGWLACTFVAAGIGAVASARAAEFYAQLQRPDWSPPASVFGPVWSALYAMMGFAAWLVWREGGFKSARGALSLFIVQLAVNALWSWLFFAWHQGAASFADIVILWSLIVATLTGFWRKKRAAGVLLLPYLAWVTFAAALCYSTWKLNPSAL